MKSLVLTALAMALALGTPRLRASASWQDDAGDPTLQLRVTDSNGEPVTTFFIGAGIPVHADLVAPDFRARYGTDAVVNWQGHWSRKGANGVGEISMKRLPDRIAVRVESPGYVPFRSEWIDSKDGSRTLEVRLAKDDGIPGIVLLPNGRPAAGAEIAIGFTSRHPRRRSGTARFDVSPDGVGERARPAAPIVHADSEGRFRIPRESERTAYVVALHGAGLCQTPLDAGADRIQLQLSAWAQVAGVVEVEGRPAANERVAFHGPDSAYPYPQRFGFYEEIVSGPGGHFAIQHAWPGLLSWSLPDFIPVREPNDGLPFSYLPEIPRDAQGRVRVQSGKLTSIRVGGERTGRRR